MAEKFLSKFLQKSGVTMIWEILDLMTLANGFPPIHQNPAQLYRITAVPVFMIKYKSLNDQE